MTDIGPNPTNSPRGREEETDVADRPASTLPDPDTSSGSDSRTGWWRCSSASRWLGRFFAVETPHSVGGVDFSELYAAYWLIKPAVEQRTTDGPAAEQRFAHLVARYVKCTTRSVPVERRFRLPVHGATIAIPVLSGAVAYSTGLNELLGLFVVATTATMVIVPKRPSAMSAREILDRLSYILVTAMICVLISQAVPGSVWPIDPADQAQAPSLLLALAVWSSAAAASILLIALVALQAQETLCKRYFGRIPREELVIELLATASVLNAMSESVSPIDAQRAVILNRLDRIIEVFRSKALFEIPRIKRSERRKVSLLCNATAKRLQRLRMLAIAPTSECWLNLRDELAELSAILLLGHDGDLRRTDPPHPWPAYLRQAIQSRIANLVGIAALPLLVYLLVDSFFIRFTDVANSIAGPLIAIWFVILIAYDRDPKIAEKLSVILRFLPFFKGTDNADDRADDDPKTSADNHENAAEPPHPNESR